MACEETDFDDIKIRSVLVCDDVCSSPKETAERRRGVAAAEDSESTKQMRSVHGRAAYYGDKSIGMLDGGSVVGKLIFEEISDRLLRK